MNPYSPTVVFDKPIDNIVKKYQLATKDDKAHAIMMQNHSIEFVNRLMEEVVSASNCLASSALMFQTQDKLNGRQYLEELIQLAEQGLWN